MPPSLPDQTPNLCRWDPSAKGPNVPKMGLSGLVMDGEGPAYKARGLAPCLARLLG